MAAAAVALVGGAVWLGLGGLGGDDGDADDVDAAETIGEVVSDEPGPVVDQPAAVSDDTVQPVGVSDGPDPAVLGFDPFSTPALSDIDLERLAAAVATLDAAAVCPDPVAVESLDDVAEVVRIAGGCLIVEYVPLEGRSVADLRAELTADPGIHAVGAPVLEVWPAQTGSYSDDPESGQQWHLPWLQARELWDGWPRGADVTVAVIDTGVDADHRDLSHSVAGLGLGDDECHRSDESGHGTHVAGIVAAGLDNERDVAGVAPHVAILPIRLLGKGCRDIRTLSSAVNRAIRHEADVINLSLVWATRGEGFGGTQDPLEALFRIAMMQEIVVVAAAGNCGDPNQLQNYCDEVVDLVLSPAIYPGVVTVAATDSGGAAAAFSTASDYVGIAAPGEDILSTWNRCSGLIKRCTSTSSGTSMAAPMVSGVVAHMKDRYPKASVGEIRRALYETAYNPDSPGSWTKEYGFGIVRPLAAIQRLGELFQSCQELSSLEGTVLFQIGVDIHADADEKDDTRAKLVDRYDVWAIEPSPEGERCRLAHSAWQPAWSPDGSRLAFVHRQYSGDDESDNDVWVMDAGGANW
ncbi:MAG: S8 family serine peptidase, partial [Actinomycetia bacterium]|nr:S8 family serine peptidase [Actinomycetes bacterium]